MAKGLDIDFKSIGIAEVLQLHRLRVPPNQRPYAWEAKEHVQQLFDDLADAFKAKGATHYFLGTIVLNRTSEDGVFEVSDGQQRLATTAIFISAIRDALEKKGKNEKLAAEKYTRNYLIEYEELVGDWSPKIQLNTQDNALFKGRILVSPDNRDDPPPKPAGESNDRLLAAYAHAAERVQALLGAVSKDNEARHLFEWANFLANNVVVIVITVPEDVDAYTMFETLNDRGLKASQVDNIKNRFYKEANARLNDVEEHWLSMIAQIESFSGHSTVISYLRHYWISENGPTVERELARRFRENLSGQSRVASFVRQLDTHAADYEALFFAPLEHKRLKDFSASGRAYIAATTGIIGIEQIRPLMLAVLTQFSTAEAEKAYRLMLSWSVRFLMAGTGGGGFLDRHYGIAAQKVSNGHLRNAKELREHFATIVPNDVQFMSAFSAHSISDSEIARYICRSMEAKHRNEKNPQIVFFENPSAANLEHILPRTPSRDWKIPADVARAYYKRIGNLTILDPSVNVEIGNEAFEVKRAAYKQSPFLITKAIAAKHTWDPDAIEERQNLLAAIAPSVWPLR